MKKVVRLTEDDITRLVKRVINEGHHITNNSDFSYPDDPNQFNQFHVEDMFEVANDIDEANDMIKDYYPGYYFKSTAETDYGKTISFFSPEGKKIASKYIVDGSGKLQNLDKFKRSNDVFYNPRKRY